MMDSKTPTHVTADLHRLQEQLHELHQSSAKCNDPGDESLEECQHGTVVIRGK